jgi:hypothetical protein
MEPFAYFAPMSFSQMSLRTNVTQPFIQWEPEVCWKNYSVEKMITFQLVMFRMK